MTTPHPPLRPGHPNPAAAMSLLGLAIALTMPAVLARFVGFDTEAHPLLGLVIFGFGIVSAAFVLTWAAEVAEIDIGSGLAIVFLALVTVLPEYAVDMNLAWSAATDPLRKSAAMANMTGANRLLIGIGWPIIALFVWYRQSRTAVLLLRERSGDVVWLGAATLYSMAIPLKGNLAWYDALVLFACYGLYVATSRNEAGGHPDLVGPPQVMADWPQARRRRATILLFLWSAGAIVAASEPFVESLEHGGDALHIDRYLLIQWLAPLASEAPEFVVVVLLTLKGRAALGLGALVSSKVNQWTLLVGGIPIAYGLSNLVHGHGFAPAMDIDARQVEELWLTATQGLYACATIVDLEFSLGQALVILGLFLVQFVGSIAIETSGGNPAAFHNGLSILYAALALERFVTQRRHFAARVADVFRKRSPEPPAPPADRGGRGSPDEQDA